MTYEEFIELYIEDNNIPEEEAAKLRHFAQQLLKDSIGNR